MGNNLSRRTCKREHMQSSTIISNKFSVEKGVLSDFYIEHCVADEEDQCDKEQTEPGSQSVVLSVNFLSSL